MKKPFENKIFALNRSRRKYQILDKLEAGIVLTGPEVKSIKAGQANISDSYIKISAGELWLIGAQISSYRFSNQLLNPKRDRKLLLNKSEIIRLAGKLTRGITLIPLKIYQKRTRIKIEIALARGLKLYNKKQLLKEKQVRRETARELKNLE